MLDIWGTLQRVIPVSDSLYKDTLRGTPLSLPRSKETSVHCKPSTSSRVITMQGGIHELGREEKLDIFHQPSTEICISFYYRHKSQSTLSVIPLTVSPTKIIAIFISLQLKNHLAHHLKKYSSYWTHCWILSLTVLTKNKYYSITSFLSIL